MTIQRLYSLPNCKLVLEGLSDVVSEDVTRPLLSILVNAECHFTGYEQPLSGGRDFLEDLVATVSSYAQEFLSGIHRPLPGESRSSVQLQRVSDNLHRLTVHPTAGHHNPSAPTQIDLVTVQLFDLVEAIDQLFADSQTLPDLTLKLAPLSKRYVAASEPMTKRAVPAAIGASSLVAAAALFFLLPAPQVRRPQPASSPTTAASGTSSGASPSPAVGSPPNSPTNSPTPIASPSPAASATPPANPSPSTTATPSPTPTATTANTPLNQAQLDALLNSAPEVTNEADLSKLTLQLRDQLDQAWKQQTLTFDQPLVYRVGVSQNGDILGFKYVNDASIAHVNETPLLDLRYNATTPNPSSEPIAQFRVVFTPSGVVQVSPWHGEPSQP